MFEFSPAMAQPLLMNGGMLSSLKNVNLNTGTPVRSASSPAFPLSSFRSPGGESCAVSEHIAGGGVGSMGGETRVTGIMGVMGGVGGDIGGGTILSPMFDEDRDTRVEASTVKHSPQSAFERQFLDSWDTSPSQPPSLQLPHDTRSSAESTHNTHNTDNTDGVVNMNSMHSMHTMHSRRAGRMRSSLQTVKLAGALNITDETVQHLVHRVGHSLTELDISYCPLVTAAAVEAIALHCPKLRTLSLCEAGAGNSGGGNSGGGAGHRGHGDRVAMNSGGQTPISATSRLHGRGGAEVRPSTSPNLYILFSVAKYVH